MQRGAIGAVNPAVYNKSAISPISSVSSEHEEKNDMFLSSDGNKASKQAAFGSYEQKINAQNSLVIRHEEAHFAASGPQASGSPVYNTKTDKDGRQIIFGGHQNINIPGAVNANAPLSIINRVIMAAGFAARGAVAPQSFDELSDADKNVAAISNGILSQAETAKAQRLSFGQKLGLKEDEPAQPEKLVQSPQRQSNSNQSNPNQPGQKFNFMA